MKAPKYIKGEKKYFRHSKNNPKNLAHIKRSVVTRVKEEKEKQRKENLTLEKNPFVNTIDLNNSPRLFEYLRENSKYDGKVLSQKRMRTILKHTLKLIAKRTVYNEAGVFIKNFGYFCIVRYPSRKIVEGFVGANKKKYMNFQTKGFPHSITFIPIRKDRALKEWVMERAFHRYNTTRIMSELLKEGKRYKMAFSLLHNLFGNRIKTVDVIKKQILDNTTTANSGSTN